MAGRADRHHPGAAAVIRAGALATTLAVAASWYAPVHIGFTIAGLFFLVAGLALLIAGHEPWPRCCEHCPIGTSGGAHVARHRAREDADEPDAAASDCE